MARKHFWAVVSTKLKQNAEISAVVEHSNGVLKCGIDEIRAEVEQHLCRVFQGSFEEIPAADPVVHVRRQGPPPHEHSYTVQPAPALPSVDSSAGINTDPAGWINKEFSDSEVLAVLKTLKGGKSVGWDTIPF